ncbi:DeoR/GlpR family DNA-binding transcription regulator [Flaviflexus equikiangi]|uniref:Lactose phosphotransferase system repressor n=1 Tax=Flaviflexus equikiangi TaxID=2758573 RepID=A0ABS2THF5_9ACTO|nr:DeoR/GlpR family DNA-binding transcription regulator [Flaviflexus equikiangi]MBM9433788.1 DeoR/GlpR transcriptional regulator [Flaviflexus equikiangi]
MLPAERRKRILDEVRQTGGLDVVSLSEAYGVSKSTIRRDLNLLDSQGMLQRVRGGTIDADPRPYAQVVTKAADEKSKIGHEAATLVEDGDIVLIDIGTTTAAVAQALYGRHVTVLTASLAVIDILRDSPGTELIVLGGVVRNSYLSMVGSLTSHALSQLRADIAFLGTSGVRDDLVVMDSTGTEVPIKHSILKNSTSAYLVASADKFPGSGILQICSVSEFDGVITTATGPIIDSISSSGVQVIHP